jgi:hypothetical protein
MGSITRQLFHIPHGWHIFKILYIFFAWFGAEGTLPPVKLLQNGRHVHEHTVIGAAERNGSVSVIQNLRAQTLKR